MNYIIRFPPMAEPRDPRPATTQFLGFVEYATCRECGQKVKWRVRKSYRCADGRHIKQYLVCPNCGAKASRITDIPVI